MIRRLAFTLMFLVAGPALADEAQPQFAPSVLSQDDVTHYRQIIAAERAGKFDKAQTLYEKLGDTSLKGYIQAEHILSPHSGRTPVSELATWMRTYAMASVARICSIA